MSCANDINVILIGILVLIVYMTCINNVNIPFYYLNVGFTIRNESVEGHFPLLFIMVINDGNSVQL